MRDPQALISTSELEAILGDPSLRVFDCTTTTVPPPPGSDVPYIAVPGWQAFEEAREGLPGERGGSQSFALSMRDEMFSLRHRGSGTITSRSSAHGMTT